MAGRHSITRETAFGAINTPTGRGVAAAVAVGTMFGVALPSASADDASTTAALAPTNLSTAPAAEVGVAAVTAPAEAEWNLEQVSVNAETSVAASAAVEVEVSAVVVEEPEAEEAVAATAGIEVESAARETTEYAAAPVASNSALGSQIVAYARQFSGAPYVSGGTSPSGWDCSGYVQFVFSNFGISTPRTTGAIRSAYTAVPASEAQPGDIVWWPGHVGIYTGNGAFIAAANPSTGTFEQAVYGSPVYLRVVG